MKFSVLLPTRNRLELLRYAIESVRRQDYADWEIVVSDNDSTDDVAGYVASLRDARIMYIRTKGFIPVTENWNYALAHSSCDYVVMLGDDDCLLPGYFRKLSELIEKHGSPEAVYVEAVQYAYPGVIPGHAKGFVQTGYCEFMRERREPFILAADEARSAVAKSMGLRLSFSYNMQHSLVSRAAIERLKRYGPFFQSPYPDYYASNVLLLTCASVLVVPEPLVAIGISPKSFGYYYFNDRESEGTALLNNLQESAIPARLRSQILPGNVLFTCWFIAMAYIEENFGKEYALRVDPGRYRYLQVLYLDRRAGCRTVVRLLCKLSARELLVYGANRLLLYLLSRMVPGRTARRLARARWAREGAFPEFDPGQREVDYRNILELFENWSPQRPRPATIEP